MNKTVAKTIGKREVNTIIKKIGEKIVSLKSVEEVEKLLFNVVPDALEVNNEIFENSSSEEFVVDCIIPRQYTGKHTKEEFKKEETDFDTLGEVKSLTLSIYKSRTDYKIVITGFFSYFTQWHELEYGTLFIKEEIIKIPLEYRAIEIEKIKQEILGLSSGTIATLIAEEKIGNASSKYLLIDEVQKRLFEYVVNKIESANEVPKDWQSAWLSFKRDCSIKEIAYSIGLDESEVEPNYEIAHRYDNEILETKTRLKSYLNSDIEVDSLPKDVLKDLSYVYCIKMLKSHCTDDNQKGIDRILNYSINAVKNNELNDESYVKYAKYGYEYLKKC